MNRKESREQNDISIIIGSLPQRLQKKFAENCSADIEHGTWRSKLSRSVLTTNDVRERNDATDTKCIRQGAKILTKLSRDVTPDLEASGSNQQTKTINSDVNSFGAHLPGVLHLNPSDGMNDMTDHHYPKNIEHSHKQRTQFKNITECPSKDVLPISPVRFPLKLARQPDWFTNLDDIPAARDLPQLYESLMSLMKRNVLFLEWHYFCEIHKDIREIFTQLLLQNLKFVCEQKVDTFIWKLLFYNIREYLKSQMSENAKERMLDIIDIGFQFYQMLHTTLSEKYLMASSLKTSSSGDQSRKFEFIAKVAIQKILICLGDLSRYRSKQLQNANYNEATKYYENAQSLIPTNAIPYNQLAIVAIHARKQFDAVYFHMRSLMSSNAINTAKESLLVLFDEIRRKFEDAESKTSPVYATRTYNNRKNSFSRAMRKEIWIYPDGVRRLHRTDVNTNEKCIQNEEQHLKDMKIDELMKRFISLYLYVIGKLYTGIGMETILLYQRKLLIHFNVVLQSNPLLVKRSRLLKLVALNIFLVENNIQKEFRREIRYHAFNFANQMFGLVVHKCNLLFGQLHDSVQIVDHDSRRKNIVIDITSLLQYVRIYVQWLSRNIDIWEPLRSEEHSFIDCWAELKSLFENIQTNYNTEASVEHVTFEEDIFLMGFTPLAIAYKRHETINEPSPEDIQFYQRLNEILKFNVCMLDNQQQLITAFRHITIDEYAKLGNSFENLSDSDDVEGNNEFHETDSSDDNSENIVINGDNIEIKLSSVRNIKSTEDTQITQLTKLKKELEAKSNVKKHYNAKLQEILNFVDMKIQIEVRPKYLLPDTNCFIDYLESFERLVREFKHYTLVIPLTVVKELDGLSKGVKIETYEKFIQKHRIHHYDDVSTRAMKSLEFIKSAKSNIKCATTKGSFINASLFGLVEEEHVSNDDKILATAMSLSKTMSNESTKDGKCLIRTELVLITTDRNLRVKALSRNLAVSELSEFLQWANDCNKLP